MEGARGGEIGERRVRSGGPRKKQDRGVRVGTNGLARCYNISGYSREQELFVVVDGRGQGKERRVGRSTQSAGVRGWKRRRGGRGRNSGKQWRRWRKVEGGKVRANW